jgi:hypothetical protein
MISPTQSEAPSSLRQGDPDQQPVFTQIGTHARFGHKQAQQLIPAAVARGAGDPRLLPTPGEIGKGNLQLVAIGTHRVHDLIERMIADWRAGEALSLDPRQSRLVEPQPCEEGKGIGIVVLGRRRQLAAQKDVLALVFKIGQRPADTELLLP